MRRYLDSVSLALLSVLSLVVLTAPDVGASGILRMKVDPLLWRCGLVSLSTVAVIYLGIDRAESLRSVKRRDSLRVGLVMVVWLIVAAVATFGRGDGVTPVESPAEATRFLVTGPIAEELLFRGAIFALATRIRPSSKWFALVFSSLLFGLTHLQYYGFDAAMTWELRSYTPLVGLVFGYMRLRSGSIVPGLLAHVVGNTFSVLAAP